MLSIEMLPARQGDALWVEYGEPKRRLLVDAGVKGTWEPLRARIEALPQDQRHFELLVVTHIDNDHVQGVIPLLTHAGELGVSFKDIWFNGYRHLPDTEHEALGPVEGERLTKLLIEGDLAWNEAFARQAVVVPGDEGPLPRVELEGSLSVTVLSPYLEQLEQLKPIWSAVVTEHNLNPTVTPDPPAPLAAGLESLGAAPDVEDLAQRTFTPDTAVANGTSIALLLEMEDGPAVILAADAFPTVLQSSIARLLAHRGEQQLSLAALKLPHHGSRANVNCGLLELLDCPVYLFSTDGTQTRHPHPESVARVLSTSTRKVTLAFNYRSEFDAIWRDPQVIARYGYEVRCPSEGETGLAVVL